MEIEGFQEFDLECEDHDLIESDQFPETVDAKKVVNCLGIDMDGHLPELCESTEPERNQSKGRYNLRKSLAWDSAFFTSAGVLDAEELSSMITFTGSDKNNKHVLPGIQEEISGSTESISTLQSDSLTLEALDDELFLDIRASIQRSSKKVSNLTNSSSTIAAMELVDGSAISSPRKEDFVSQNKNPKPGLKKTSGLQTVRMSKSQPKPAGKPPGRPIKQDSVQSQMHSVHPRPLKTISSSLPSSTSVKRDSAGAGLVKPDCGSSKQGPISSKGTQPPKISALGGSRKVLPKSAVLLKSSSITSSLCSASSSTSSDNSINLSSGNSTKPTVITARRNLVKNSNITSASSGLSPKTLSRAVSKNKLPAPTLSSNLKSAKISASVSPASSISEWSSASSTTSSVINHRSNNLRTSLETSSCMSVDGEIQLDPRNNLSGQKAERQGNQEIISISSTSKKPSTESGTLPAKPSGLRLPSPKIGFFDGSSSRTPNGHQRSQSSLHPGLPKKGTAASTPTQSSNGKLKIAKVPTARTTSSLINMKSGSPRAASPALSQEKSHALVKTPTVPMDVNDDKQVLDEGTNAVGKDNLVDLSLNKNDSKTAAGEDNDTSGSEYISQASTPTESAKNKLKSAKGSTTRKAASLVNIKSGPPKAASPASSQEKSQVLMKESGVLSILPVEVKESGETCQKAVEAPAGNGDKQVVDAGTSAVDENNLGDWSLDKIISSGDIDPAAGEGSYTSGPECLCQIGDRILIKKKSVSTSEATASCQGEGTEDNRGIYKINDEPNCLLSDKSECGLSSTLAAPAAAATTECFHNPTELVIQVAGTGAVGKDDSCDLSLNETMNSGDIKAADGEVIYTLGSEYISETGDNVLIKKKSVPTSEAIEKENDPANYPGQGPTVDKGGILRNHEQNCQLLSDTSQCALFSTAAVCRPPFAVKNNPCSNEYVDNPSELVTQVAVAGNTGFALPSEEVKEIS